MIMLVFQVLAALAFWLFVGLVVLLLVRDVFLWAQKPREINRLPSAEERNCYAQYLHAQYLLTKEK